MQKINNIAIIDDDPIVIFGISKMLSQAVTCNKIEAFNNGKIAIDAISEKIKSNVGIPDIIFLDINMPIMDGWQFLEKFLKLKIDKKIVINIVTSSIDSYDRDQWIMFKSNSNHKITFNHKPMSVKDIIEITKVG